MREIHGYFSLMNSKVWKPLCLGQDMCVDFLFDCGTLVLFILAFAANPTPLGIVGDHVPSHVLQCVGFLFFGCLR